MRSCGQEARLLKMVKDSFDEVVNKDHRTAAYLALYVDSLLRVASSSSSSSSTQHLGESELESQLDLVIVLFRHIHDKGSAQ